MTVKDVAEVATMGGAKVNHLDKKIGSLTPGKQADIMLLDTRQINVMPLNHTYGAVVLAMETSNVDTVLIAGRLKKWRGRLVGLNLEQLRARVEASRLYVLSRAGWPNTAMGGYLPGH
jgi:cytosine/adenosine deaminase-related metal-dependent hydrolase